MYIYIYADVSRYMWDHVDISYSCVWVCPKVRGQPHEKKRKIIGKMMANQGMLSIFVG
jgi:hypothetical protein